jgi:hypothetical protein
LYPVLECPRIIEGEEFISGIEPLELLEPEDGLDPIFRVKKRPETLLATEKGDSAGTAERQEDAA